MIGCARPTDLNFERRTLDIEPGRRPIGASMVRIEKQGDGMDLYIVEITRLQMVHLEKESAFLGKFYWRHSLRKIWYTNTAKMRAVFGVDSFRQMRTGDHRYLGPLLASKKDLEDFISGIRFYEDDEPFAVDPSRIRTRFRRTPALPRLTDANVVVFHGEHYKGTTSYEIRTDDPFSLKQLRLELIDCGDNGYILQGVTYNGKMYLGKETAQSRGFLQPQFVVK